MYNLTPLLCISSSTDFKLTFIVDSSSMAAAMCALNPENQRRKCIQLMFTKYPEVPTIVHAIDLQLSDP